MKECCVKNPSHDEAVEITKRIIANGGMAYDLVTSDGNEMTGALGGGYRYDTYPCWGFNTKYGTYTGPILSDWYNRCTKVTIGDFRKLFPFPDEVNAPFYPEGTELEVSNCGSKFEWCKVLYMGNTLCVVEHEGGHEQHYHLNSVTFRPIQTDRERFITQGIEAIGGKQAVINAEEIMGKLFDNLISKKYTSK